MKNIDFVLRKLGFLFTGFLIGVFLCNFAYSKGTSKFFGGVSSASIDWVDGDYEIEGGTDEGVYQAVGITLNVGFRLAIFELGFEGHASYHTVSCLIILQLFIKIGGVLQSKNRYL